MGCPSFFNNVQFSFNLTKKRIVYFRILSPTFFFLFILCLPPPLLPTRFQSITISPPTKFNLFSDIHIPTPTPTPTPTPSPPCPIPTVSVGNVWDRVPIWHGCRQLLERAMKFRDWACNLMLWRVNYARVGIFGHGALKQVPTPHF